MLVLKKKKKITTQSWVKYMKIGHLVVYKFV